MDIQGSSLQPLPVLVSSFCTFDIIADIVFLQDFVASLCVSIFCLIFSQLDASLLSFSKEFWCNNHYSSLVEIFIAVHLNVTSQLKYSLTLDLLSVLSTIWGKPFLRTQPRAMTLSKKLRERQFFLGEEKGHCQTTWLMILVAVILEHW